MRDEAAYENALLRMTIDSDATSYRHNPSHYYSGINALTLMHLYRYLTNDPRYDRELSLGAADRNRPAPVCSHGHDPTT